MKKRKIVCLAFILVLGLSGCNNKKDVESNISVTETIVESNYIDITETINDIKNDYNMLKDFGLKHGLLYNNGEQTDGVPIMEEITPLKHGDEVVLPTQNIIVNRNKDYDFVPKETDESAILSMLNEMTLDEIYDYIGGFTEFVPVGTVGEGSSTTKEAAESILGYMGYNDDGDGKIGDDGLLKLSESELLEHASKVIAYGNLRYNKRHESYKRSFENSEDTFIVSDDGYDDKSKEYQNWYVDNIITITRVRGMDFTKEVLPDGVIFKDDKYYLDKSVIKPDESGMVTFSVYGQIISLNVL